MTKTTFLASLPIAASKVILCNGHTSAKVPHIFFVNFELYLRLSDYVAVAHWNLRVCERSVHSLL